jgi:hypothetical protein
MAFSVNDYGKDGPTKDSQDLLDKHIATWAAEQGIEKYTVGKKDVTCELFLNLIVFDEHTCTARATVCWGGDKAPGTQEAKKKGVEKTAAKSEADGTGAAAEEKPKQAKADAAPAEKAAAVETKPADAKPAETAPAAAAAAAPTAAPVETGALPVTNKTADNAPASGTSSGADGYSVSDRDAVAAAAAAAERAAAAAERAAAAAERAAAAAAEQAAAIASIKQNGDGAAAATPTPAAADATSSAPPAYGAPAQPVVAPIQPEAPKP